MKVWILFVTLSAFASAQTAAESAKTDKPKKAPRSGIVVRPGPPVKPTQVAKPNGPQKSDWGDSATAKK